MLHQAALVMGGPRGPQIFDVAPLIPKLPIHTVANYDLAGISELPGGDHFYLHFGHHSKLMIMNESGLHFEGAYVEQRLKGDDRSFGIHIVSNSHAEASGSIRLWLSSGKALQANVQDSAGMQSHWADTTLLSNNSAINAAIIVVTKALLYLGSSDPDIQSTNAMGELSVQVVGQNIGPIEFLPEPMRDEILANFKI
ncbi:hypothetical protein GFL93_09710 [Rhizobium leguminosarum bv. viciae]|uniref:hypothetical protein n=1 Tax=Rhizobium TaxID=379 RepID=UPI001441DF26|nr:hypothetical protein [Rhizobium leguminosarum]NKK06141.1 hypothetical protein [Rhizobium leguminosarum bv. viciae]